MLYILYIALTLVGDWHLFQTRANVSLFYSTELKQFSYSYSPYSYDRIPFSIEFFSIILHVFFVFFKNMV